MDVDFYLDRVLMIMHLWRGELAEIPCDIWTGDKKRLDGMSKKESALLLSGGCEAGLRVTGKVLFLLEVQFLTHPCVVVFSPPSSEYLIYG